MAYNRRGRCAFGIAGRRRHDDRSSMKLFAPTALLPEGWADNVSMSIDAGGAIASVRMGEPEAAAEHVAGALVPGMANVHSHAFQRGIAGRTGRVLAGEGASFWTWRYAM